MISVVVCTYNRSKSLASTLNSLAQMTVPAELAWELIIVDNNSRDDTREVCEQFASRSRFTVRYVFEGMQGHTHARNRGIAEARGEIVAFTDDDVTVDGGWLQHMHDGFERFDCVGVVGKILPVWTCPKPRWFQDSGPYSIAKPIIAFDLGDEACEIHATACGASMAFRKEAFARYGAFRTDLGRCKDAVLGGDDVELFQRFLVRGARIIYAPKALVYHPVEEARASRAYFQSWFYDGARSQMRMDGLPKAAVCYLGVPRYFLRSFATQFIKWNLTVEPKKRFYHKLQVYFLAGMIVESRRLSSQPPARPVESKVLG